MTALRIAKTNCQDEEFPDKSLLIAAQDTKKRYAFKNNILRDIKLNKTQLLKINHSGRFLGNKIDKLGKGALLKNNFPLAKDIFPLLANRVTLFVIDNIKCVREES